MGTWVVELNGVTTASAAVQVRFAMGPGVACTDDVYIDSGFLRWQGVTQHVAVDTNGIVTSTVDVGEVQILNMPDDVGAAGFYDALPGLVWRGRLANLYWLPANVWADAVLVASNALMQPVANLSTSTSVASTLRFPLRDPRAQLIAPLQFTKYLGNNDLYTPYGFEGDVDLKGKPKPILYGVVSNIPGVLVNRNFWVYQVADKAATVLCVRDGGVPLTQGIGRANITSLFANTPAPGSYDYTNDSSYGCFVRLGSTPVYKIGIDAQEGAASADRTHAQIWKRLRIDRVLTPSARIDATSVSDADTLDPNEVGFWWPDETTEKDAIDTLLASFSGYEVKDLLTKDWSIHKLVAPVAPAELGLVLVTPTAEMKASDRPILKLDRVQPTYLPDGTPPWRVNVQWGRNYTVMAPADFAGNVDPRLKEKFSIEWRQEPDSDVSLQALWSNPGEMTIPTGYQPGPDNLTCPQAALEAARIRALYSFNRPSYQASFRTSVTDTAVDNVEVGQVYQLTYPMYGLDQGQLFRVMQGALLVENGQAVSTVVLALQSPLDAVDVSGVVTGSVGAAEGADSGAFAGPISGTLAGTEGADSAGIAASVASGGGTTPTISPALPDPNASTTFLGEDWWVQSGRSDGIVFTGPDAFTAQNGTTDFWYFDSAHDRNRSEIAQKVATPNGTAKVVEVDITWPSGAANDADFLSFLQWRDTANINSAPFAFMMQWKSDKMRISLYHSGAYHDVYTDSAAFPRDTAVHFKIETKISGYASPTGYCKITRDGVVIVNITGVTIGWSGMGSGCYFKAGVYRGNEPGLTTFQQMVFENLRIT